MQTIGERIRQRRRQMLVHSYIYYELDSNIVSDAKWAEWAKELAFLQKKYPKEAEAEEYAEMFRNWDGSSGAFLIFGENIKTVAKILLSMRGDKSEAPKSGRDISRIVKNTKKMKKSGAMSLF